MELDASNETLGKKVRNAKASKVPYYIVLGKKEVEAQTLSVESRDNGPLGSLSTDDFIAKIEA